MKKRIFALLSAMIMIFGVFAVPAQAAAKPGTTKITSVKESGGKVTLKWNKISGADGYVIYYAAKNEWAVPLKTITKQSTLTYTTKKLGEGSYIFFIVGYVTVNGEMVLGEMSNTKKIKIGGSSDTVKTLVYDASEDMKGYSDPDNLPGCKYPAYNGETGLPGSGRLYSTDDTVIASFAKGGKGLYVGNRVNTWDSVDVCLGGLAPGSYTLQVKFSSADPVWFAIENADSPWGALALKEDVTKATLTFNFTLKQKGVWEDDMGNIQNRFRLNASQGVDYCIESIRIYRKDKTTKTTGTSSKKTSEKSELAGTTWKYSRYYINGKEMTAKDYAEYRWGESGPDLLKDLITMFNEGEYKFTDKNSGSFVVPGLGSKDKFNYTVDGNKVTITYENGDYPDIYYLNKEGDKMSMDEGDGKGFNVNGEYYTNIVFVKVK